jgi:flagellar hook assembly protein FlgD
VSFTLELPRAGDALVEVLDLSGRRVRTLHSGAAPAGPMALAWDGTGERGRAAPSGLYFIRAISGGASAQVRFALVR